MTSLPFPTRDEYKEALRLVSEWVQAGMETASRECIVNADVLGALNRLYLCVTEQLGEWSDTFPQEEGLYWFFGQDFGPKHGGQIRLHTVKVHRIQNGYAHVCDGHFIYPSEAVGVWLPITLPEFPKT